MPPQSQITNDLDIKRVHSPEVGATVVSEFLFLVREKLLDPEIKKILSGGSEATRKNELEIQFKFLEKRFLDATEILKNFPPSSRKIYQRSIAVTYYSSRAALAGLAGKPEEEENSLLNLISEFIGKERSAKVNFYTLKWGSGNNVALSERTSYFSNLWGLDNRKVASLSLNELEAIRKTYLELSEQEKGILLNATLEAGDRILKSNSPTRSFQISQLLNLFVEESNFNTKNNAIDERKLAVLAFDTQMYKKLALPKEALIQAEELWQSDLKLLQTEKSPKNLLLTLHGANLLAEAKFDNLENDRSTPIKIRELRQKVESITSGMLYKDGKLESDYMPVASFARSLLVAIQKKEIEAFRKASNSVESESTLAHLAKHYSLESKALRDSYLNNTSSAPPLTGRFLAGIKNFASEFSNADPLHTALAGLAGCGIGVKLFPIKSWQGAAIGCAVGAGVGLSTLSLLQVIKEHERVLDGFKTGHSPHESNLILALDCINVLTTIIPPVKVGLRLTRPAVLAALKSETMLSEKLLNQIGKALPLKSATEYSVDTWNKIYKVFPKGLPENIQVYEIASENLEKLLTGKAFRAELKATLGGPGEKFIQKVISASKSGRDALTKEELEGVLKVAVIDYIGDAGPTIWGAGLIGSLGSLTQLIIDQQQHGEANDGSNHVVQFTKHLATMFAFSIALHKTQQKIVSTASNELNTLRLAKPSMVQEREFLQSATAQGVKKEVASELFKKYRPIFVAKDPVLENYATGKFRHSTLERAQEFQQATGKSVFYLEFDVGGLGALNEWLANKGRNHAEANRHFNSIAKIVKDKLHNITEPVPFHHGGDEFSHVVTLKKNLSEKDLLENLSEIRKEVEQYVKTNQLDQIPPTKDNRPAGLGIYVGVAPIQGDASIAGFFGEADKRFFTGSGPRWSVPKNIGKTLSAADGLVELAKKTNPAPKVPSVPVADRRAPIPTIANSIGAVSTDAERLRFKDPNQLLKEGFTKTAGEMGSGLEAGNLDKLAPRYERHSPTGFIAHTTGQLNKTMERAQKFAATTGQSSFYLGGSLRGLQGLNSLLGASNTNKVLSEIAKIIKTHLSELGGDISFFHKGGSEFGIVAVNVTREQLETALAKVSKKVSALPKENKLIQQALKAKGLPDVPPAKTTDTPGIHFDGAVAPLHTSVEVSDVYHYVEGIVKAQGDDRRNTPHIVRSLMNYK